MDFTKKISALQNVLNEQLLPIVSKKCIYLDLPYHFNIGDTLIWEGTEDFISKNNINCLYRSSCETYAKQKISSCTSILLHGGGNFGDIWPRHQEFRKKIIEEYPNNNVVILPQTVYYSNIDKAKQDAILMSKHKNLTICARDISSYNFLIKHFKENRIIMVPDMAFYIAKDKFDKNRVLESKNTLYLKRKDKELKISKLEQTCIPSDSDVKDWPTMDHTTLCMFGFDIISRIQIKINIGFTRTLSNFYAQRILKPYLIKTGVKFVSSYKNVYTTRLHVAILSLLLEKPFTFFDNSYGKNRGFYETWLSDVDNIKFINEDN